MFRSAEDLNGVDAWRRVVRIIDSGVPLRIEELRGERCRIGGRRYRRVRSQDQLVQGGWRQRLRRRPRGEERPWGITSGQAPGGPSAAGCGSYLDFRGLVL